MNAAGGRQEALGTWFAWETQPYVEIGGVMHDVEIIPVDNQSDTAVGPTAAAFIVAEGAHIVLGSYGSAVSMASSDVFRDAGLTAIGVSCTNPGVTRGNDHYFRICFLDPFQGQILANLAWDHLGARTAYVLALLGDDYSMGLSNYFIEAFTALGGEYIFETYPLGTSDFSAFMINARALGADVMFVPSSTEAGTLIIDSADVQDTGIPLLAGDTWDSNVILQAAHGTNVTLYITTFYEEGGNPDWDRRFRQWLNDNPGRMADNGGNDMIASFSALGYDAYWIVLDILQRAGSLDQDAIRAATWETSYTAPVLGLVEFDEHGDAKRDSAIVKSVVTDEADPRWQFVANQRLG
jgi:branched-chain amino acid transport system substrate-binding protein